MFFKYLPQRGRGRVWFSLFLILLIILPIYFFLFKKEAEASWWDEKWFYRRSIPVTNSSGSTLTDFQIKILNNYDLSADITNGKIQSDLDDLRFTTINGEVLNYWIEDSTNNSVDMWVKIPSISTSGATVYMYYGNSQATPYSDGNKVFDFFDDFNIFDETKWAATGNRSIANGKMTVTTGAVYSKNTVADTPQNKTIEMKAKYSGTDSSYSGICISNSQSTTGSNSTSKALAYNMSQSSGYNLSAWGADGSATGYNILNGTNIYTQTLNTDYILGYTFQGTSNIKYFVKDLAYADLGSTTPTGTWNYPFYLWLGFFMGFSSSTNDIDDVEVDWVRVRKYASTEPTTGTFGTEEKSQAPVGYWSFDEGYGAVAYDQSSNKKNGNISGAIWKNEDECMVGKCLFFDGTDDSVLLPNDLVKTSNIRTSGVTYSAWIKTNNSLASQRIIGQKPGSGYSDYSSGGIGISNSGKAVMIAYDDGVNYMYANSNTVLKNNTWYYVTGVFDSSDSKIKLYINGKLDSSPVLINTFSRLEVNGANSIGINIHGTSPYYFKGFIDEAKIYPYARTADQIKQDYNAGLAGVKTSQGTSVSFGDQSDKFLTDGLVGHWKMDEISGTTVADSSGNGNTGTLTNAQEVGTSDASGNTTTTMIDTDGTLATADDAYNGMILRITAACGSIASGTEKFISDYVGATKTFTLDSAFASIPNSCSYEVRHQTGGRYGNGINFDGGDDIVEVSSSAGDEFDISGDVTVSLWFNVRSWVNSGYDFLFRKHIDAPSDYNYEIVQDGSSNKLRFLSKDSLDDSHDYAYVDRPTPGSWHHIVGVRRGTKLEIYLDGVRGVEGITGASKTGAGNIQIGALKATLPDYLFDGKIDETRVYNRALSIDEIKKLYEYAPGPVGHWKMDEKVQGDAKTIADISGNGNNGTTVDGANNTGMDCSVIGKIGGSCDFDGIDDYINIGSSSMLASRDNFTLSAWINPKAINTGQPFGLTNAIIYRGDTSCTNINYLLQIDDATHISFKKRNVSESIQSYQFATVPSLLNRWTYVSLVVNSGYASLYLNGQLIEKKNIASITNTELNNNLKIGVSYYDPVQYPQPFFPGAIDDVKIYNYARTQEQILEDMGGQSSPGSAKGGIDSPILDLNFDEGYSNISHNSGLIETDGSLVDGPTWTNDGKMGKALSFDGLNDRVQGFTNTEFKFSDSTNNNLSFSFWVKPDNAEGDNGYIISKPWNGSGQYNYSFKYLSNETLNITLYGATTYNVVTTDIIPKNKWTHIIVAMNADKSKLINIYINGKLSKSESHNIVNWVPTSGETNTSLLIGSLYPYDSGWAGNLTYSFKGLIDEVKLYNYYLTADDAKTLYNGGSEMSLGGEKISANNNGATVTGEAAKYCIPGDTTKCDNPVLELNMDEMSGSTVNDTSGNGNNGTLISSPAWFPFGQSGSALNFNGNGKRVTLATPFGQSGYTTASLWYKRSEKDSANNWRTLLGHTTANIHHLIINSTSRNLGIFDGTFRDFGYNPPDDGKWHHYEVIYNSGVNATLYVDGIYKNQITTTLDLSTNPIGSIGNWGTGNYWAGLLDEVKIYNYVRTPAQIAWDYNRGKPIAHWKMDEGEGITAHDESGNGNNGTLTNMDSATDWVEGKNNKALDFDNMNDSVMVSNSTSLNYSKMVSISTWINSSDVTANQTIVSRNGPYFLRLSGSRFRVGIYTGTWLFQNGAIPLENNTWYHLTLVYDGATVKSYVNGKLDVDSAKIGELTAFGNMYFGYTPVSGENYPFNGQIDDVKIYNYALTAEQVKQDYAGGAVNFR